MSEKVLAPAERPVCRIDSPEKLSKLRRSGLLLAWSMTGRSDGAKTENHGDNPSDPHASRHGGAKDQCLRASAAPSVRKKPRIPVFQTFHIWLVSFAAPPHRIGLFRRTPSIFHGSTAERNFQTASFDDTRFLNRALYFTITIVSRFLSRFRPRA